MSRHSALLSSILALSMAASADDFDTPGERAALNCQLETIAPGKSLPGWHALSPISKPQTSETPQRLQQRIQQLNHKLDSITIPEVTFQNTPLRDALEWLRKASKEFDPLGVEPNKGIVVLIKSSKPEPAKHPSITLQLKDATLRETLVKLTTLNKIQMEIQPYAVELHVR